MKKIIGLLLAVTMMFALGGCNAITIDGEGELSGENSGSGAVGFSVSTLNNPFFVSLSEGAKESATIYSLLGNCAMRIEKYEKAVEYYEKALSMEDISEELSKETKYNLVAAYEYAGNIDKAKENLNAYIEAYPDDESAKREAEFLETR